MVNLDGDLIRPMLAAAGSLPTGEGWAFEFKYDGVRAVTYAGSGGVQVLTRNDNDVTSTYPELAEVAALLGGRSTVVDGEIVALEAGSRPSFSRLQNRMHVSSPSPELLRTIPVRYYVFDLLRLGGKDTTALPYAERRVMLGELGLDGESIRTPPSFLVGAGLPVLQAAEIGGFEGVVAKRLTAPYRPGRRSGDWTKVPLIHTQEVLIIGWEPGDGRRSGTIGSLLLGVVDGGDLRYAGQVGTGFTDAMLGQLRQRLEPLARETAPVTDVPRDYARHARWVEPELVGEVAYRNWTPDGRLRHPSWRGLRPDRGVEAARVPASHPSFSPHESEVTGSLSTNDGRWRVEVVSLDGEESFRVQHGDDTVDGLSLAQVQDVLHEAGIDLGDLADAVA